MIDSSGRLRHLNWTAQYEALRAAANASRPGYLWHEAALWDDAHDRWLFWPRKESHERFDAAADERRGSNLILTASGSGFEHVSAARVQGAHEPTRGYSAVKLLPGSSDVVAALRTYEVAGLVATYLSVLRTDGTVLMDDTHIADRKYEGLELAGPSAATELAVESA